MARDFIEHPEGFKNVSQWTLNKACLHWPFTKDLWANERSQDKGDYEKKE